MKNQKSIVFLSSFGLILTACFWGFGFVVVKDSLNYIGSIYMVTFRYTLAAVCLSLICFKKWKLISWRYIKDGFITGTFLFLGYVVQTIGCSYTTAGKNAFLTTIYVILIPFFSWILYKKKPEWYIFVAAILSITGIGFLSLSSDASSLLKINKGDLLTLLCGVFYALHIMWTSRYTAKGDDPLFLTMLQFIFAAIFGWILSPIFEGGQLLHLLGNTRVIISILYLGIFSTMISFSLQNLGLKYVKPELASLFLSFESVFGVLFSVIFLNEKLSVKMIFGCVLIFVAVILAETKFQFIHKKKNVVS